MTKQLDLDDVAAQSPLAKQELEQLREQLKRVQMTCRWVDLEDKFPQPGEDVLLWCGWRITGMLSPDGVGFFTEDGRVPVHHVTHWARLIDPPVKCSLED